MDVIVPTLSTFGWVKSRAEKIDFLIAHYLNSDKNQTDLYSNNVTNLEYTIQQYTNRIDSIESVIRTELINYLRRYYDEVDLDVTVNEIDANSSTSKMELNISAVITDNGDQFQVSKVLQVVNGQVQKFINANNYGKTT